jgi:hypothetical protein
MNTAQTDPAAFRRLVLLDAHDEATREERAWLRSAGVCERWRDTLAELIADYRQQRHALDQALAAAEQDLLPRGGAATYAAREREHAQAISKIVRAMGDIQRRLGEANTLCAQLHPFPAAWQVLIPTIDKPLTYKSQPNLEQRVKNLERTIRELREENARLQAELGRASSRRKR